VKVVKIVKFARFVKVVKVVKIVEIVEMKDTKDTKAVPEPSYTRSDQEVEPVDWYGLAKVWAVKVSWEMAAVEPNDCYEGFYEPR
jgi:hypothetical protein